LKAIPHIILASASPRRALLLREMGLRFMVIHPDGVEELVTGATPEVLVMQNAQRKARAIAGKHREALVIGADTIVVLEGVAFGKPRDLAEAETMLARLSGRRHEVFTGVCVIHRTLEAELTFAERTRVWMRSLSRVQIRDYFTKVNPLDKSSGKLRYAGNPNESGGFSGHPALGWAGAYAIQQHGDLIVERIEGSFSNVMGLPVERLQATFEKLGMV
jgi:septum formation protein